MWFNLLEKRLSIIFDAMIPNQRKADINEFIIQLSQVSPPLFKLGVAVAVVAIDMLSLVQYARSFSKLSDVQKDKFLESLNQSSFYLIRQLLTTVKVAACFGYFSIEGRANEKN